jgi:starch phosphorylase
LRLWAARAPDSFHFHQFGHGDFVGAVTETLAAESITRVLYPDDSTSFGQELRFLQEFFLCACSIHDIIRRFRASNEDWGLFLKKSPSEKWPLSWFENILPRQLEIIYEINRRFLDRVREQYPGDDARLTLMSLIEEGATRKVRMANLAIVGSHSTNGVAAIHTELLKKHVVPDFAEMFPQGFNNKTNGVTPRRWLLVANPRSLESSRKPSATAGSLTSSRLRNSSRLPTMRLSARPSVSRNAARSSVS